MIMMVFSKFAYSKSFDAWLYVISNAVAAELRPIWRKAASGCGGAKTGGAYHGVEGKFSAKHSTVYPPMVLRVSFLQSSQLSIHQMST
jgi:hypothetical protein